VTEEADLKAGVTTLEAATVAARVRPLLPDIDQQIRAGVRRETIVEYLRARGLEVTLENLKKILSRYRRQLRDQVVEHPSDPPPTADGVSKAPATPPPDRLEQPVSQTPAAPTSTFEDMMDPKKRDAFADQFMTPKPLRLGQKKES